MGCPFHHILRTSKAVKQCLVVSLAVFLPGVSFAGEKVTESVIVASVEGEVSSLNMIDDFKVTMGPSSVGKKISSKTILSTGKTGKVGLLFSNGTLITVKPGSRFYLRKYKQLEAVVEDLSKPGELEEEPTKSELSAHLDFGELIVKAPKLKKGSSMNLTSPLGTAGIRGTMFQMMAVRNSVSGDISGGVNLISGDIDWTDTGGTVVTLLSGQSIQLVTSKLGEALGSKTGELVDLSATYGPALTEDGAMPPPTESLLASFSDGDEESEEDDNAEESDTGDPLLSSSGTASWEFIHNISSEIFFEIESNEVASSSFSFDSMQSAPAVEVPAPETQPLGPPPEVTGEKDGIANPDQYVGPAPEIALLGKNEEVWWRKISNNGFRMIIEMRSASDTQTWLDLDPGIQATDYLGTDLSSNFVRVVDLVSSLYSVDQSNLDYPQFILHDPAKAPIDVPNIYNLTYIVRDYRGFRSSITRNIEIVVTEPTFDDLDENVPVIPMDDPDGLFESWINDIVIEDVRGRALAYIQDESARNSSSEGYFYLDPMPEIRPGFTTPNQETTSFQVVAVDWRGVEVRSSPLNVTVKAIGPTITGSADLAFELSSTLLEDLNPDITAADEFGSAFGWKNENNGTSVRLVEVTPGEFTGDSRLDSLDQLADGASYTFTYQITDSRGVMVEENRKVRIQVSGPQLSLLDFQSQEKLYGIDDPHPPNTLEYTDPWGELLPWLQSVGAMGLNDANFTDRITLNDLVYGDFTTSSPELVVGENVLTFKVIDPRYEPGATNSDWLDDLTDDNIVKTINVVKSPPKFESLAEVPAIPMNDPDEEKVFAQWIADINITDVRGERLLHDQNQSSTNGYFYLNEYPELYLGFTEPKQETFPFEIEAVDWRGESSTEASSITVVATGPTIAGSSGLTFELSNTPIDKLDPDITAVDEFGNSISTDNIVLYSISPGDYSVDARLDSLVKLEEGTYSFTYQITDSRGVMVEESRNITIEANSPELSVADFQSSNNLYPTTSSHPLNTIEYDDPWEEISPWLRDKVSAQDYNGSDLTSLITLELNGQPQPGFTESTSTPNLEIGDNALSFTVVDPRYLPNTDESWADDLTVTYSLSINAVVTPPTIVDYKDVIDTIPMRDLNNVFGNQLDQNGSVYGGWLSSVQVKDVRGQIISYDQSKANIEAGYFYLSPMPDLSAQSVYFFRIYARDWRNLEDYETNSELLAVEVKAISPTIEGGDDYVSLEVELSSASLSTIDPQITAQDEFNASIEFNGETEGTISLANVIGPNSETPNTRIDQLEEGFPYVLDYEVIDFRGIKANVKRYLQVVATSPTIETSTIAFRSAYDYGTAKSSDWTIEYTDPATEYSTWFSGITAKVHDLNTSSSVIFNYEGVNFTKTISSSEIEANFEGPASIETLFNYPGSHDLNLTIVDPRYEVGITHQDWKDNLTFTAFFTFEVIATKPDIDGADLLPDVVPMEDPGDTFQDWIDAIEITDLEGSGIDYDQDATVGARFYLDPMPDLDPGFLIPDENATQFEIVAIDSRGVERRSAPLTVIVKAKGPTISGSADLSFELNSSLLKSLDPDITAADEFGSAITSESIVLSTISPGSYTGDSRLDSLDQLSDGETYTFTYQITDSRGVMVEETRNVSIEVTAPTLMVSNFKSSNNVYPTDAPHPENTLEYKDPWGELLPWLQSASALDLNNVDLTSLITLEIDEVAYTDFSSTAPDLAEGSHELVYEVIDPRYEDGQTNSDWLDDLTTQLDLDLTVVTTPATFDTLNESVPEIPMDDPAGLFADWINSIIIKDVRGGDALDYLQDESTRNSSSAGYFYLDPMPVVAAGFTIPEDANTSFKVVAVDWRVVERRSEPLDVTVKATGPTITGSADLTFELSSTLLKDLDSDITAADEFSTAITGESIVLSTISPGSYTGDSRLDSLDQLSDGATYAFTYQITDSRGVMVEETRNVSIQVTAPTLTVSNFQSLNNVYSTDTPAPHDANTVEYKDPWGELLPWLQSAIALDLNNVDLTNLITLEINGVSDTDFSSTAPDLAEGSHELVFEVIDPRYENGQTNSDWLDDLSLQQSIDLEVVKTAPVITIDYNSPRTGLSWNEDTSTLTYLVKPNATNGYETKTSDGDDGDDGEFAIGYDNGVDPLPVRKPFFQAIDFNGSDISNEVEVVGVVDGLYDVLTASPHHNISLSVNDHNTRDPVGGIGVISSISITLKIVDVLAPIMVLKEDSDDGQLGDTVETPFIFEGIAASNIEGSAEFPDPGYYIYDNYYTSEQIKSHLGIGTISNTTYSYPESPNKAADSLTKASFMDIPDQYVISSDVNLGAEGNYTISYQNITDPSGNQASESLVRYVSVFDERDPEVKIFGASTIYENLGNILTEQETYLDRGAYAYEDLSEGEGGLVNWQEEGWDWSVSVENWDFSSEIWEDNLDDIFGFSYPLDGKSVEDLLDDFKDLPGIVPTDLRLRLTYQLADEAGNLGTAQRVVNFTNSPNLIPTIMLLDPAINNPHEVEVDEIDEAPAVEATLDYSDYDEVLYSPNLRNNEYFLATTDTNETVSLPDWDKVNFHRSESGVEYYVEEEGGTLNFHDAQSDGWRKFIVHYSAANPSFPENVGILDLEVRIQDTTSPSFTIPSDVQDLEAGVSFTDGGISGLVDNYFNKDDLTTEVTITKTVGEIDQVVESPISTEDVFLDLENEGFWEPGSYTITHTALDDFNNSTTQSYNISVVDTIAPHISLVTEDFLNNPGSVSLKAQYDTETLYLDVPNSAGVPTFSQNSYSTTEWSQLWAAMSSPNGWDANTFDKASPYVVYQQNKTFYLKQSEISNIDNIQNGEASETNVYQDDFGRSFIWYSAFVLNNGIDFLRDPGVLIVNPSDYDVTVTSEIQSTYQTQGETNQLTSLKFSYKAIQNNAESSEISLDSNYSKTLIFLDEVAPTIFLTPEELGSGIGFTNSTDKFFLIEAGVDYLADSRGTGFKLWNGTPDTNPLDVLSDANNTLSVSAIDVVDGNLDDDINRTIIDVSTELKVQWGSNTIAGTDHLNKIYLVEYDVRDGDDLEDDSIRNWAETARRYFIVKDTTPPVISSAYNDTNVTISATSDVIDLSDIEEVKEHLISDLLDQITDIIDSNYVYADFNVTIGKSANPTADDFDGAEVYPEDRNDPGYYVTITVKDDSGNISDPINRELKIGDYEPPVITLNGDAIVHDFFRYGKNIGFDDNASAPKNEELLFADQASSPEFNSTGFGGGAHRLFLSQYNFTDPGAYAEDGNTSTNQGFFSTDDNFPDFDGDGVGEGHAILRKDDSFSLDADDMDIGIIYARSSLTNTTFQEVQEALEALSTYSTSEYSSQVPDVNTYSFTEENKTDDQEVLNIQLYLIEYRVKDGWGNLSEIKTRRVYFYESRQFGEFGFYATPLFDSTDPTDEFPDQNLTALSDNQKDYDGDGISDFWENALGTEYDDASSFPDSNGDGIPDLGSNQLFQNLSVTIPD